MGSEKYYQITNSQIKSGVKKSLLGSLTLAGYAKDILERGGDELLSLGLYSFAVEEYGKSVLLEEFLKEDRKVCSVPQIFFRGKKSHDIKFKKALSVLPIECIHYDIGLEFSIPHFESKPKRIEVGPKGETIHIPGGQTGIFSVGGLPVDFETRMNCFYLDWDEQRNKWKNEPKILSDELRKSIIAFEEHVAKKLNIQYDT